MITPIIYSAAPQVCTVTARLYCPASCVFGFVDRPRIIEAEVAKYRLRLSRRWEHVDNFTRIALFVMLNPSTAHHMKEDATTRRLNGFCKSWGLAGYDILNLFALRSTHPKQLWASGSPYLAPHHHQQLVWSQFQFEDEYLKDAAIQAYAVTVFAWGTDGDFLNRDHSVGRLMWGANPAIKPMCFGFSKRGMPLHPLRLAKTTQLVPYTERPA